MDFDRILHVGRQDLLLPASISLDDQVDLVCLTLAQAMRRFKYEPSLSVRACIYNTTAQVVW
jgi:hypothetical protein